MKHPNNALPNDFSLSLTRDFGASVASVWRCMVEPDLLRQWFVPAGITVVKCELDPTPGGTFHLIMDVPEMGEMDGGAGCVLVAEPERRLIWTSALGPCFVPNPPAGEGEFHFSAVLTLDPLPGGGTRYTATALHMDEAGQKTHAAMGFMDGWGTTADQLGALAKSLT